MTDQVKTHITVCTTCPYLVVRREERKPKKKRTRVARKLRDVVVNRIVQADTSRGSFDSFRLVFSNAALYARHVYMSQ